MRCNGWRETGTSIRWCWDSLFLMRWMPQLLRHNALLVVLVVLQSCVSTPPENWPETLPDRQLFVAAYQADARNQQEQNRAEYLDWILNFYQGSLLYSTGWQDIERLVLERTAPSDRPMITAELNRLGFAIASEWAKSNDVRVLDNRLLSLWGYLLQIAPDSAGQTRTIGVIAEDIAGLLSRRLAPDTVNESRYEALLGIELFEGF